MSISFFVFIKSKVRNFLKILLEKRRRKAVIDKNEAETFALKKNFKSPSLTKIEKQELKSFWGKYIKEKLPYSFYEVIKGEDKFDIAYVSHSIFFAYILPILNMKENAYVLSNKGIYSFYFSDINRPAEIAKNICGNYYIGENVSCSKEQAINAIIGYKKEIIMKPSIESSRGLNIEILSNYSQQDIEKAFQHYGKNFVVQEVVKQSLQTARFNPTSLNTFRITTLLLNGEFSILSSQFRCGGVDSIVDNAGAGGIIVGIHPDGTFYKYGYNSKGERHSSSYNGISFWGNRIEHFEQLCDFVRTLHYRLPFCSIVGWDVALDANDSPILIEVNLKAPGIEFEQLCSGPFLKNRLPEILNYVFIENKK